MSSKLSIHERFAQANRESVASSNSNSSSITATSTTFANSRSPRLTTSVLDAFSAPSPILEQEDGAGEDEKEAEVKSVMSARSGDGEFSLV